MNALFWLVVAATLLSGFFSLTGYAMRTYRRSRLEDALPGPAGLARIERFEANLTALTLTAAFGRALSNMALIVLMLYLFNVPSRGWHSAVWVSLLTGAIIAIFGVAIPHAWGSLASEKILASTLGLLTITRYALYPVVASMMAFEEPIRRLSGLASQTTQAQDAQAKQEILEVASEGQATGAVEPEQVRMIRSVVEFAQMQAGQVMTPRTDVFAIPADTPWKEACRLVAQSGHARVPVFEGDLDNIIGIVYAKDLLRQESADARANLRDILRKPFCVPETKHVDELLREFRARKVHVAIVLDEYGGTAGLVSMEDVLEEIIGEISDEYDKAAPAEADWVGDGVVDVAGRLRVDELNKLLELHIPEDADYDTVAGLIFWELGYIPSPGEKLSAHGAQFTVLSADERRITKIRVEAVKESQGQ